MTVTTGLLLALAATAGPAPDRRSTQGAECAVPRGWNQLEARAPDYVVFGELHGTRQGPAFVGDLACALASRQESVLVAIEHHASDDAALQAAWKLPAERFAAALARTGWAGREDGVASKAMFAMLVQLHRLKQRGMPIAVTAFNGARDEAQARRFADLPGQGPHEAAQAENIATAAASGDHDHVLVLVGNFHAQKGAVERGGASFDPMARRLARTGTVVALDMRHAGGTSWHCGLKPGVEVAPDRPVTSADIACGAFPSKENASLDAAPFLALGQLPGPPTDVAFDGFFWAGAITASPPQVPDN